tara:strand:+ start:7748 stop:9199 length:1452 start_codon:yes stop_codon:yes gene_type:complete
MRFSEFETMMQNSGFNTLAEIARALDATPQAVSNWKSRDQVPYHIVAKIRNNLNAGETREIIKSKIPVDTSSFSKDKETILLTDILLMITKQLKVIFLITFISVFVTFTYVQFIQTPEYVSSGKILLPSSGGNNLSGLAGLANQFGVNVPTESSVDLSSPSLYPELLSSRTFAEKLLNKNFFLEKYNVNLSLLRILNDGDEISNQNKEILISRAINNLNSNYLGYEQDPKSAFSIIKVIAPEPKFAKELADVVLHELELLNRFFKSQKVTEKISFIENRILSVEKELEFSEKSLKTFKEKNRQVLSPALLLEQERFERQVEVQKGIYLTLKQQYELSKIEEIQEASVIQILDYPQTPLFPSNKNLKFNVILAIIVGILFGAIIGIFRSYANTSDIDERKKLRQVKTIFRKKLKDIFLDSRITGVITIFMFFGLPLFLGYRSKFPTFFGLYSTKLMIVNTLYVLVLIITLFLFLNNRNKNKLIK